MVKFYVLGVDGDTWVLDGYDTRAKAVAAIRWQNDKSGKWLIATRTGPDTFTADDGQAFTAQRGPYTAKHFDEFKAEWKA